MDERSTAMRIFVAGATGALGRRAVEQLLESGHDVTGIARSVEKAEVLKQLGASAVRIDPFDAKAVGDAVRGHDVVMNLATHIPSPARSAFPSAWRENDKIRTQL
jgi:nucleoside-diphosphate-sugar epimerase